MMTVDFINCKLYSGNRTLSVLRRIERNPVIHIFDTSPVFFCTHKRMQYTNIKAQIFMNDRSTFRRVFADFSSFPHWLFMLNIAYWYHRSTM